MRDRCRPPNLTRACSRQASLARGPARAAPSWSALRNEGLCVCGLEGLQLMRKPLARRHGGSIRAANALALALLAGCSSTKAVPDPVYRYINILDGSMIRLGEPLQRLDIAERVNDTTYSLIEGNFSGGGTDSNIMHTDSGRVLRGLTFTYDGSETAPTKVREYTASLGAPSDSSRVGDEGAIYVWQDSQTRFELHYVPGADRSFWSRLTDRQAP